MALTAPLRIRLKTVEALLDYAKASPVGNWMPPRQACLKQSVTGGAVYSILTSDLHQPTVEVSVVPGPYSVEHYWRIDADMMVLTVDQATLPFALAWVADVEKGASEALIKTMQPFERGESWHTATIETKSKRFPRLEIECVRNYRDKLDAKPVYRIAMPNDIEARLKECEAPIRAAGYTIFELAEGAQ